MVGENRLICCCSTAADDCSDLPVTAPGGTPSSFSFACSGIDIDLITAPPYPNTQALPSAFSGSVAVLTQRPGPVNYWHSYYWYCSPFAIPPAPPQNPCLGDVTQPVPQSCPAGKTWKVWSIQAGCRAAPGTPNRGWWNIWVVLTCGEGYADINLLYHIPRVSGDTALPTGVPATFYLGSVWPPSGYSLDIRSPGTLVIS
jgi:hypothetical protein